MYRRGSLYLLGPLVVAACAEAPPDLPPEPAARAAAPSPGGVDADALVVAAAAPGLAALDGDVALVCDAPGPTPGSAPGLDGDRAAPDCDAALVDARGGLIRLGRGGLVAAARLDPHRLALLTRDRRLVIRTGDEAGGAAVVEVEIARDVADPRPAPDRRAIAFTQLPPGAAVDPSTTGRLVVLDLDRGTRRVVTDHPLDSAPFVRPGGDDVLFVSGRTGVASLFLARPGEPVRQLTNRGARAVGPGFVPVPGRELTWLDDGRVAVFTARYGGVATLWAVDVDSGAAASLGDGRWPRPDGDDGDGVLAVGGDGAPLRLSRADVIAHLAGRTR